MNPPLRPPLKRGRAKPPSKSSEKPAVRVMIVDDSLTVRTIFRRMVESDPGMEVADTASSAERAIAQIKKEPADVVLLDLEMPGIGGLKALPDILKASPGVQVLVVSSLTQDGTEATVEALSNGAADTLQKPRPGGFNEDYRSQLLQKIRALGQANRDPAAGLVEDDEAGSKPASSTQAASPILSGRDQRFKRPEVVAIGASTGGIHALNLMLRELTPQFSLPILITQHLPSNFIPVFARQIEVASGRPTHIAEDRIEIRRGEIAIATGHAHMTIRRISDRLIVETNCDPVSSGCLPSVDPMLSSLANACDGRVLAVILSGMGRDGYDGAREVAEAGGRVWAQDADTCAVWGMPGAVTKAGLASMIGPPQALGKAIIEELTQPRGIRA